MDQEKQAACFGMLCLAFRDATLVGWRNILAYLNGDLRLRTLSGGPIKARRVRGWAAREGFPLLRGKGGNPRKYYLPLTSRLAVQAWVWTRERNGRPGLFTVPVKETCE